MRWITIAVAPTLARVLGVAAPSSSMGRVLGEALVECRAGSFSRANARTPISLAKTAVSSRASSRETVQPSQFMLVRDQFVSLGDQKSVWRISGMLVRRFS